jgi:predicted short-subunit dehydrogenase-like oxidoreductase (DUF2520 family)
MKNKISLKACVIGAGRVGTTVSYLLAADRSSGLYLSAVSSKSDKSLQKAKEILGEKSRGVIFTGDNIKAALSARCVLICTPDDFIKSTCEDVVKGVGKEKLKDYFFIHFSGSKQLNVLRSAEEAGAGVASIHPIKSFSSIEESINTLKGTYCGVTYSGEGAMKITKHLVKILGGKVIEIPDEKKPVYHAASCAASNYLITLLNYSVEMFGKMGIKREESIEALIGLVEGTVINIKRMGIEKSLTGPIARGDLGTIEEHLKGLNEIFKGDDIRLYKILGKKTINTAYKNGWIKSVEVKKLKKLLED